MATNFQRPDIFRPPSERNACFLPLTKGCSNNTCGFCGYYGTKLQMRDLDEVKREIDALALYLKTGTVLPDMPRVMYMIARQWDGQRVFLQDADALVYPFPKLKETLDHLNEKLPFVQRVAAYATPRDILIKGVDQLRELRERKLGILYVGIESGDDDVLKHVAKGATHEEMVEAGRIAREAGVTLSLTVLLGLGGVEGSRKHALETAGILSEIDPEYAGALTLTLVPGTPLYEEARRGEFHPIDPFQSLEELKLMVEHFEFTDCFFSSMHASNYLPIRGRLPRDKRKLIKELESALSKRDPKMLRPEFMRGL
ncbi:MAG: radical SAM protein [Chloroflexota bacterium]|nr:radical SAM protein [Chloroflexota bacterium]